MSVILKAHRGADPAADWIDRAPRTGGIERIEAFFHHTAYDLHRHDTYAIGRTLAGVQSVHYRRSLRNSVPGTSMPIRTRSLSCWTDTCESTSGTAANDLWI